MDRPIDVFCMGRFDLIHPGHLNLFEKAKEIGDFLTVGIIDKPFKEFQYKEPAFSLKDRGKLVKAIKYVDWVVLFQSEEEVGKWLSKNPQDYMITGEEYKGNQPLEKYFPEGGMIYLKTDHNRSSKIKQKIKNDNSN